LQGDNSHIADMLFVFFYIFTASFFTPFKTPSEADFKSLRYYATYGQKKRR